MLSFLCKSIAKVDLPVPDQPISMMRFMFVFIQEIFYLVLLMSANLAALTSLQ